MCGLRADGSALCWGFNDDSGQTVSLGGERFISVSVGANWDVCGLRADGSMLCWDGTYDNALYPPEGERFDEIGIGRIHSCGLKSDGSVLCWITGTGNYSEETVDDLLTPPQGERFESISVGSNSSCGIREDGVALCWGSEIDICVINGTQECWKISLTPPDGERFSEINRASCGVTLEGGVACWNQENLGVRIYGFRIAP